MCGFVMVQDLAGVGLDHLSLFNLATIKKMITLSKTALPARPKVIHCSDPHSILHSTLLQAAHILNRPGLLDSIEQLVSNLQDEKMKKRKVCSRYTAVHWMVR